MKKRSKKVIALFLTVAMLFTLAVPAFADNPAGEKSQLQKDAEAYALQFVYDYNADVYNIWDLHLLEEYTKFSVKDGVMTLWFNAEYMSKMKKLPEKGPAEAIEDAKETRKLQDWLLLVADVSSGSMKNMQVFIEVELGYRKTQMEPLWPLGGGDKLYQYDPKAVSVTVDGVNLRLDQAPVIEKGRTLVPLRGIFEALDAEVDWNQKTQTVTAKKGDVTVTLEVGKNIMVRNGQNVKLDVPAKIMKGRTMIPLRAVSEAMGAEVDWSGLTNNVSVTAEK